MRTRPFGRLTVAPALLLSIGFSGMSRADTSPTDAQLSAARDLFIAAEKDEDAQRWKDAFEKLQRVSSVKLTSGVRYHTALCEEHLGHLVAALRDYKAAANQAHAEHAADVIRLVDKRVADSGDRVPHLIVLLDPDLPDAAVWLDGEPIQPGVPVSVDPGPHTIEAHASGHRPSTTSVAVKERDSTSIAVTLDPLAAPLPSPTTPSDRRDLPTADATATAAAPEARTRDRAVAIAGGVTALALVAGGIGAYVVASSDHAGAVNACAQVVSVQSDACDARKNTVRTWDWIAVSAWAGALTAGTLAVVSIVRLRQDDTPFATLVVGPGSLDVRGAF